MKYTNMFDLPEYVRLWLEYDSYDYEPGIISATRLMSPARQYALYQWHQDELQIDISELVPSRYGTAIHDSIEKVHVPDCEKELRLYADITIDGEVFRVSGKFDMLINASQPVQKLVDVKSTSAWSVIYNDKELDYIKQLSIYKYLANFGDNDRKYNVGREAEIMMVFTDWNKVAASKDPKYPQLRIKIKKLLLWDDETTEEFIRERLVELKTAKESTPETLIECSPVELWKDEDKWAIIKDGGKRAVKVFNNESKAIQEMSLHPPTYHLEHRRGIVKRCKYCLASEFCSQYKELVKNGCIKLD